MVLKTRNAHTKKPNHLVFLGNSANFCTRTPSSERVRIEFFGGASRPYCFQQ